MFIKSFTTEQKNSIKQFILDIIDDILKVSLISFLILTLFEMWRPGFVVNYLNMNALLTIVLSSGIVSLLFNQTKSE